MENNVERSRSGREAGGPSQQRTHVGWVLGCGAVLMAAYVVPWHRNPVPVCTFRRWTGYPCAFCGSTRSFQAMAHGRWTEAVVNNPLASLLFLAVAGLLAWHALALALRLLLKREVLPRMHIEPRWWLFPAALLLVVANWAYRIGAGLK